MSQRGLFFILAVLGAALRALGLEYALDLRLRACKSVGRQKCLEVKDIRPLDIPEEAAVGAPLGVLGVDQGTDVRLQDEQLVPLHRLLKGPHQRSLRHLVAEALLLVELAKNNG